MADGVTLQGKAVVVTGAGRGLGRAYALAAAERGARVVVNDVDAAEAEQVAEAVVAAGGAAVAHPADVSDPTEADGVVARCAAEFGSVDGLVNNAGYGMIDAAAPQDQDPAELRRVFEVNVFGSAYCGIAALRHMVRQGAGSIVNDASVAFAGAPRLGAYSASKGATASLTLSWAADLDGTGVRVNAISPMAVTRSWDWSLVPDPTAIGDPERLQPEDNTGLVVYLLSDAAAGVHGQLFALRAGNLNVVSHAGAVQPTLQRDRWTAEQVADAVAGDLRGLLQPPGLRPVRIDFS
ncbi:MAG TPA: SDR family oxidoreductase [Acidimicrobiales bacterium]|nr:SDR family oxidoreductase [Acidimicrobiales bacterium]